MASTKAANCAAQRTLGLWPSTTRRIWAPSSRISDSDHCALRSEQRVLELSVMLMAPVRRAWSMAAQDASEWLSHLRSRHTA
jgi:hypothetical protein